uniref:Apolipoprotein D n=1 Tax=Scophthalmus maximus TaxID=52904 RepID=A0A8D3A0L7_SCOMX
MSAASLLLLLLPLVSAQTYHWGPCPTAKVQPNFNLQQYLGRWYEIARLPASFERGTCIQANYALREDGTIRRHLTNLKMKWFLCLSLWTAVVRDPREPAKLGVSFSYFSPYGQYWVLTSDYTSLSVVYSCTDILRIFHIDFAWILGRSRILPPETIRYAKNLMIGEGIDLSRMKFTNQTGCRDD